MIYFVSLNLHDYLILVMPIHVKIINKGDDETTSYNAIKQPICYIEIRGYII